MKKKHDQLFACHACKHTEIVTVKIRWCCRWCTIHIFMAAIDRTVSVCEWVCYQLNSIILCGLLNIQLDRKQVHFNGIKMNISKTIPKKSIYIIFKKARVEIALHLFFFEKKNSLMNPWARKRNYVIATLLINFIFIVIISLWVTKISSGCIKKLCVFYSKPIFQSFPFNHFGNSTV